MNYTYTRQNHDLTNVRFKNVYISKRLVELTIALRNISEEAKDLADELQQYAAQRSLYKKREEQAARSNVTSSAAKAARPVVVRQAPATETDEPRPESSLDRLKKEIVRWLINAPTDPCEDIAPLVPAPLSLVKRIRVQLVDAGKLRPLEGHNGEGHAA